jgi:hypothetical protein
MDMPVTTLELSTRRRDHTIAALLAFAFPLLLCAPHWLSGRSVFAGVIQEQYYLLGQFSFDHQIIEDFSAGRFPLWNPHNALGTPLLGNMLSTVFYPLKVLIYLASTICLRDLYIILRLWLAGFFAYVFARSRGASMAGSILVMAGFSITGYFRTFINENYLNADVLIPLLLISLDRIIRPGRLRHVILAGIVIFAILNCGHPEAAFYAVFFGGLYFLVAVIAGCRDMIVPALFRLLAAFILGFLLSLPLLLPFLEYWSHGVHFHPPGAGFYHYPIRQAIALLSPWFFHPAAPGSAFLGPVNMAWNLIGRGLPAYHATSVPWLIPYIGILTVFLVMLAFLRMKNLDARSLFFAAFAAFFLGVMFGLPFFNLIGFLPIFSFSGNFKHPMPALSFALVFLAGKTFDDLIAERISFRQVLAAGAMLFLIILGLGFWHEPLPAGRDYLNPQTGIHLLILALVVLWLAAASRWRAPFSRNLRTWLIGAVAIFALSVGLVLDGLWHKSLEPDYLSRIKNSPALNLLDKDPGPHRTYIMQGIMPPNLNIVFGINDLRVMDGINDRYFVDTINEINAMDRLSAFDYWYNNVGYLQPRPEAVGHPLFELFNVRYILSDNPLPYNDSISGLLKNAKALAPLPDHLGRVRIPFQKGEADALLQHPPCRLEFELSEEMSVVFQPGIVRQAWRLEKDGVWFGISCGSFGHMAGRPGNCLLYARYLHPGKHDADQELPLISLPVPAGLNELILSTLPHASADHDWAGWADLRIKPRASSPPRDYRLILPGSIWLYQSDSLGSSARAQPRAFLAGWAEVLPDESSVLKALSRPGCLYKRQVFLAEQDSPVPFTAPYEWSEEWEKVMNWGELEFELYSPQKLKIRVKAHHDCWLVLSDLYYPGWEALVDDHPCRIYRGDYLLRVLPLSAGSHMVEFRYKPVSFRLALWSALVSLFVLPAGWSLRRLFS